MIHKLILQGGIDINWEAITAIVELLGLVLIVVSLVYLAIQTRSINKQNQSEARYAFVDAVAQINMIIAQNTKTASIWRRGLVSIQQLSEDEQMQFFMFLGQYSNLWSVMHQLYEDNVLPETQWIIVRNDIVSILGSDGGQYFWKSGGEAAFDPGFSEFVNSVLKTADRPYDMARMTDLSDDTSA